MNDDQLRLLAQLAANRPRVHSTSATPEQVDLVVELHATSRAITEHCRMVLVGDGGRWAELAELLNVAARACRNQVVLSAPADAGRRGGGRRGVEHYPVQQPDARADDQ